MTDERRAVTVVTGASSGLGRGFAERFAARRHDLVLVARRAERLEELAARLRAAHGVAVDVIPADLADAAAPARIAQDLADRGLRAAGLINCAGFGTAGAFTAEDPDRIAQEIAVDVTAPTLLTRLLLPDLLAAPHGVLLMVSSTASHQPIPNLAVYAACKAFLTSLTAAIWQETRGSALRVLAVCPGPTATEFFAAAGSTQFAVGRIATTDEVVAATLRVLDRPGGPVVTLGWGNRIQSLGAKFAPRRMTLRVGQRATERAGSRAAS
ncbi:SDR family oxidoreductase [Microbacterium sp. cx-59]|uniref:SDR family NAD(P)-dependent oxidoreductase n=1 Tax=Microbacterium sp. cx-59 TaxID=2891207 RepID=UPI001E3B6760|nr:SDR family NAD(P)-dependent oxidoreductase [Microbacterium sp. cx-59]MCC4908300.1 SDR family NAD(P)-dependent oxidoreductase [Microbacterium sp. cx-59]